MSDTTSSAPTSYSELADVLKHLPILLRESRRCRRLSVRAAAAEIGCSFATVARIEEGEDCVLSNAMAVLTWLGKPEEARADG